MSIKVQTSDLYRIIKCGENIAGSLTHNNSYLKVDRSNNLSVVTFDENHYSIFGCSANLKKRKKPQIRCALSDILKVNLPGLTTSLWINSGNLIISSNDITSKFAKYDNLDSPPKICKPPLHFEISKQMLEEIFKSLNFGTNNRDRIENNFILLKIGNRTINAYFNDRYMFGNYSSPIATEKSASFRLPVKMLGLALKVLDDSVLIGWKNHNIRFCSSCADVTMKAKIDDYAVGVQIDVPGVIEFLESENPLCKIKTEIEKIQKITNQIIDKSTADNSLTTEIKLKRQRMSLSVEMSLRSSTSQTINVDSDSDFNANVNTQLWRDVISRLNGLVIIRLFKNKAYIQDSRRSYLIPLKHKQE